MALPTEPIRDEHEELLPGIETLRRTADRLGHVPPETLREMIDESYEFLAGRLIPHAIAEDEVLYPVVARLMGAADATRTMSRDHVEVARLTEKLGALRSQLTAGPPTDFQADTLRRLLYGLHALVTVHFAKEEEIYLPILDARLDERAAGDLFARMEAAARIAHGRAVEHAIPGSRSLHA